MLGAVVLLAASSALDISKVQIHRRAAMSSFASAVAASAFAPPALAGLLGPFPGERPADLGVRPDGSLKGCPPNPNCWSTSGDAQHLIKPFVYVKATDDAKKDLMEVLRAYPQAGIPTDGGVIDGGGNKIVSADGNYVNMEFTSKKFGFVDDVEFYLNDGKVAIRSSSRQGDSDLGVNAARLKFIASSLGAKSGWTTNLGI